MLSLESADTHTLEATPTPPESNKPLLLYTLSPLAPDSLLFFFLPNRLLVTLANKLLAGLGGVRSGTVTQLLTGRRSGV